LTSIPSHTDHQCNFQHGLHTFKALNWGLSEISIETQMFQTNCACCNSFRHDLNHLNVWKHNFKFRLWCRRRSINTKYCSPVAAPCLLFPLQHNLVRSCSGYTPSRRKYVNIWKYVDTGSTIKNSSTIIEYYSVERGFVIISESKVYVHLVWLSRHFQRCYIQ